jgi:hypothetical protein
MYSAICRSLCMFYHYNFLPYFYNICVGVCIKTEKLQIYKLSVINYLLPESEGSMVIIPTVANSEVIKSTSLSDMLFM